MADYRELLRKAIDALPENTGANRRAVYEKARGALVAQLRAIDPPLPAREITQHRLNLEDCIRQVEQEATDKLLGRFREMEAAEEAQQQQPAPEPEAEPVVYEDEPAPEPEPVPEPMPEPPVVPHEPERWEDEAPAPDDDRMPVDPREEEVAPEPYEEPEPYNEPEPYIEPEPEEPRETPSASAAATAGIAAGQLQGTYSPLVSSSDQQVNQLVPGSIEDIIAAAEAAREAGPSTPLVGLGHDRPASVPPISDEPELQGDAMPLPPQPEETPEPPQRRGRGLLSALPFRGGRKAAPLVGAEPPAEAGATLVDIHGNPLSREPAAPVGEAMSSVREVDLEPAEPVAPPAAPESDVNDPQTAIDRAIEALDREARGEVTAAEPSEEPQEAPAEAEALPLSQQRKPEPQFAEEEPEERGRGVGALTVFLLIAVLLLVGGGAAGFWAWREGYVDLETVFAQADPAAPDQQQTAELTPAPETVPQATDTTPEPTPAEPASGAVNGEAMPGEELPFVEPAPESPAEVADDRLPAEPTAELPAVDENGEPAVAEAPVVDGPQSLLLEEQPNGAAGAVPYTGNVTWSRGSDELGNPTIQASASIPARNLSVDLLLRRNADQSLPASHLMEVNFTVSETFVGGSVASLPGILLKNEELVQGEPLTGASARIVGNSFLFALSSASERDVETNQQLLESQGWLDVAMVYGTGRRAILTLEKGEDGQQIFEDVLAAWAELDGAAGAPAADDAAPEVEEAAALL